MISIVSKNIPDEAKNKLQLLGEVIEFSTSNITYEQISDHPDVFLCKAGNQIICAPETPDYVIKRLLVNGFKLLQGKQSIGREYPASAHYNAVVTDKYLIHNTKITSSSILELTSEKEKIHINQGYSRCSLLPLTGDAYITSDKGIYKKLTSKKLNVLLVDPSEIILPGEKHGFFGGTAGMYNKKLFIMGSLDRLRDGKKVKEYASALDVEIIELYDGPLIDCGSLLLL